MGSLVGRRIAQGDHAKGNACADGRRDADAGRSAGGDVSDVDFDFGFVAARMAFEERRATENIGTVYIIHRVGGGIMRGATVAFPGFACAFATRQQLRSGAVADAALGIGEFFRADVFFVPVWSECLLPAGSILDNIVLRGNRDSGICSAGALETARTLAGSDSPAGCFVCAGDGGEGIFI